MGLAGQLFFFFFGLMSCCCFVVGHLMMVGMKDIWRIREEEEQIIVYDTAGPLVFGEKTGLGLDREKKGRKKKGDFYLAIVLDTFFFFMMEEIVKFTKEKNNCFHFFKFKFNSIQVIDFFSSPSFIIIWHRFGHIKTYHEIPF